jgi:predicted AAA+ superfamily ATPase
MKKRRDRKVKINKIELERLARIFEALKRNDWDLFCSLNDISFLNEETMKPHFEKKSKFVTDSNLDWKQNNSLISCYRREFFEGRLIMLMIYKEKIGEGPYVYITIVHKFDGKFHILGV